MILYYVHTKSDSATVSVQEIRSHGNKISHPINVQLVLGNIDNGSEWNLEYTATYQIDRIKELEPMEKCLPYFGET